MTNKEISSNEGTVFNIQKYSVHDGPGIRTVVFLKGCPLACKWCSNPESQSFKPELAYNEKKCITLSECVRCAEVCTAGALVKGDNDKIEVVWDNCNDCLACTDVCPAEALVPYGEVKNVKDVIDQVEKDASFYARSGGGLTLGGGEPLAQPKFAIALLKEAKHRYIKSAIETCGYAAKEDLLEACKYCNMIMFDIKSMNSAKHEEFTGKANERILENFIAIRETYPKLKIRVRTPVVPGFNDTEEDIQAIVDFIKDKNVEYELLPYHRLGTQKYINVGRDYPLGDIALDNDKFLKLRKIAQQNDEKASC
ncbi:(2S)-3-sulfopropanediol dehydratase activating enzyme [Desulforhopalus sp. 52FAK]